MLDQETKRRIDSCRDILVGKVPDPKSQVEQITIALIYKFMDDMDKESVEMGGKASFFTGKYAKYSWTAIFDPRIGGHEMVLLYRDALEKMNQNPNIHQLFRDIFNQAYLPYKDPETLKLFLKEINHFEYSHSEKLGDAFEYLLSFMGTQGDAGQFRTPRHIIDFIVEAVNPKKHETVLDPACGTAGFLISAYKHIMKANSENGNPPNGRAGGNGNQLTPTERRRLLTNFSGYDISPDMVRLSLVNLYLHDFQDPKIVEYDTLTSEERWNDSADVILANPPFMTPKGGIRPHKRFSIQAKRSEVLFVDYIAEHLNPGGRAGIIVPEGIIFQSSNAYKNLRKMLVEDYLWAVVSLPSGVFQPYSGVKTSILLVDKTKAKQTDKILFVKIENDGFDLGAQRRPIDKNDLPEALEILESVNRLPDNVLQAGVDGAPTETGQSKIAHLIEKSKIAESGDWNLSGERYRELIIANTEYEIVELGDIASTEYGHSESAKDYGDTRFVRITDIDDKGRLIDKGFKYIDLNDESEPYLLNKGDVVVARTGATYGKTLFFNEDYQSVFAGYLIRLNFDSSKILNKYYWIFAQTDFYINQKELLVQGGGQPQFNANVIKKIHIPLPPLSVQEEIVAEIDGYQKIIDGARQVVNNYKPTIKIPARRRHAGGDPDWEMVALGNIITLQRGHDLPKKNFIEGEYPVVGSNGIIGYHNEKKYDAPGVVTGRSGTIGKVHYIEQDYWPHNTALFVKDFKGNEPKFVLYLLQSLDLKRLGERTSAVPSLDRKNAHRLKTYLPPLSVQREIVAQIEAEQEIVNANKKLIEIFEQKIKDKIGEVWGETD